MCANDENESLADRVDATVREVLSEAIECDSGMYNYAILFNSNVSPDWYVVLFFRDGSSLEDSLENGFSNWVYRLLTGRLPRMCDGRQVRISFDAGPFPSDETEYRQLLDRHSVTFDPENDEEGRATVCIRCGHAFNPHRLLGGLGEKSYPEEGWMRCPEEGCYCFGTWSVGYICPPGLDGDGLRCPSKACYGRIAFVEEDPSFWGCGECGNVWFELEELYLDIEDISERHDYRDRVYVKTPYRVAPVVSGVEPADYDELVRKEWEVD